jgi:hypothetical protein
MRFAAAAGTAAPELSWLAMRSVGMALRVHAACAAFTAARLRSTKAACAVSGVTAAVPFATDLAAASSTGAVVCLMKGSAGTASAARDDNAVC